MVSARNTPGSKQRHSRKPATYADLEALPEHLVGELIDGELYASPRPASPHALAMTAMTGQLWGFGGGAGGPGGWRILFEPELHFGRDTLVPDLAAWRIERMPVMPAVPHFALAPDWICEAISPATAKLDLQKKLPKYARANVRHAWLVDPALRTLEVFRLERGAWVLVGTFAEEERVRAEPFEAVELDLGALWLSASPPAPRGGRAPTRKRR